MKLLIITPKYFPDNFSINLIVEKFVSAGHDVTLLTSFPFDEGKYLEGYKDEEINNNLHIYRLRAAIVNRGITTLIRNYLSFYKLSKKWVKRYKEKFDLVYTFAISPVTALAAGNLYSKKFNVPHYAHVLDVWPDSLITAGYARYSSLLYKVLKVLSKKLYRGVTTIIIGSPSFKEYFEDYLKIRDKNIFYIPQPALYAHEDNGSNPYQKNSFNILYSGNISTTQLVNYIVPAMNKIDNPDIHFTIIGKGRYLASLKEEINNGSNKNIEVLGQKSYEELGKYYRYSDIVYLGLNDKGYASNTIPNKFITALYYEKPVLAMIKGDAKKILEKTKGGIVLDYGVDALKEGINKSFHLSKEEKERMGKTNKKYSDEHFSLDKIYQQLLAAFKGE